MRTTSVVVTLGIWMLIIAHGSPIAAQKNARPSDLPVRTSLLDSDANGVPYTLQSDGGGTYVNGAGGVVSVLMANVFNNLYNGDWQLDTSAAATRRVAITLASANAIAAGKPGYTVAPTPPFWGTAFEPARIIDKCTEYNKSVLAMTTGATITCPVLIRWNYGASASYRLDLGAPIEAPESTPAQISCVSADARGCADWYIDPIPTVNADGTVSAGTAIARLVTVAKNGAVANHGDFYMTFHIHVTRP